MIAPKRKVASPPANRPMPTVWTEQVRGATESALDSESLISLACHLSNTFDSADTWAGLVSELDERGFSLKFEDTRLVLINNNTGVSMCTCSSLGRSFATLTQRLGKPSVLADSGRLLAKS